MWELESMETALCVAHQTDAGFLCPPARTETVKQSPKMETAPPKQGRLSEPNHDRKSWAMKGGLLWLI